MIYAIAATALYLYVGLRSWHAASIVTLIVALMAGLSYGRTQYRQKRLRQWLRENGLNMWPTVQGRLPGNLDILVANGKKAGRSLPGQGFADLANRFDPVSHAARSLRLMLVKIRTHL